MPITLTCSCGKILRIPDEHAGKRVKCPACQGVLSAPAATSPPAATPPPTRSVKPLPPKPAFEVVEDEPPPLVRDRPAAKALSDDDDEDEAYTARKAERTKESAKPTPAFRKRDEDDEDDEPRPRKKKKRSRRSRRSGGEAGAEAGRRIGYIIGGAFGLFIGGVLVIWGNRDEDGDGTRLMIFGAIVAIGGLISLIQGITGNLPDEDEE